MQILGKIKFQGEEKELLLKEEDNFFKYYVLALIGVYSPQIAKQKIIFKQENRFLETTKIEIEDLINQQINTSFLRQKNKLQIIGSVAIEGKQVEILAKIESEMIKYYYLQCCIGIFTPKIPNQTIIFKQETLENRVEADIKDDLQRSEITPLEKEQIEQFLKKIKVLEIIDRIKLQDRGIKQRSNYQKTMPQKKLEKQTKEEDRLKEQEKITKIAKTNLKPKEIKNTIKDINIKQEVNMNTRVTDKSNLKQVLQKKDKMPSFKHGDEALKMGIVESDDVKNLKNEKGEKEQGHNSRYEAVVITKKGKVQTLDLENDTQEGNNPIEKNYQVKQNDTVKKGDVISRLKVGEGTIGIEKGQYGEVEVYHSPRKTIGGNGIEGNKSLDRQLETSNSKNTLEGTNIETLKLAEEYGDGYRSVEEGYQEVKEHQKTRPNCEPKNAKDLDGDKNTVSHTHDTQDFIELSSGKKVTYQQLASRWGFYKDGKPDATFIKEKFAQKIRRG